jgi:hypothetical protein
VFDLNGLAVKTIVEGQRRPSGEQVYRGTCDDGHVLEIGMYILLAELSGAFEDRRRFAFAVVGRK